MGFSNPVKQGTYGMEVLYTRITFNIMQTFEKLGRFQFVFLCFKNCRDLNVKNWNVRTTL